jgi:hypothetical protein
MAADITYIFEPIDERYFKMTVLEDDRTGAPQRLETVEIDRMGARRLNLTKLMALTEPYAAHPDTEIAGYWQASFQGALSLRARIGRVHDAYPGAKYCGSLRELSEFANRP